MLALESDFSDVDAALVEVARSLARAVDENPAHANLWSRYLEALKLLTADDGVDDEARALFDEFTGSDP